MALELSDPSAGFKPYAPPPGKIDEKQRESEQCVKGL